MLKWEKETNTKVLFENSIDVALVSFSLVGIKKQIMKILHQSPHQILPDTPPDTPPVMEMLTIFEGEMNRREIQNKLELVDKKHFLTLYLQPGLRQGVIEMNIPDKPNSRSQKYRLTHKGENMVKNRQGLHLKS